MSAKNKESRFNAFLRLDAHFCEAHFSAEVHQSNLTSPVLAAVRETVETAPRLGCITGLKLNCEQETRTLFLDRLHQLRDFNLVSYRSGAKIFKPGDMFENQIELDDICSRQSWST